MDIAVTQTDKTVVFALAGDLDAKTGPVLAGHFDNTIDAGAQTLVVDGAELAYISSAGIRALLQGMRGAGRKGGRLALARLQEPVAKVIRTAGLSGLLPQFETVEEAVRG